MIIASFIAYTYKENENLSVMYTAGQQQHQLLSTNWNLKSINHHQKATNKTGHASRFVPDHMYSQLQNMAVLLSGADIPSSGLLFCCQRCPIVDTSSYCEHF